MTLTLRKELVKLAVEKPELRQHLLPLIRTAAVIDVQGMAINIVREAERATAKKLEALVAQAARAMKPKKFILVPHKSYLSPAGYGSSDGSRAEGEIFFEDKADVLRTEEEARNIFQEVLDTWPRRQGDLWSIRFGK